jgi:hypothetical protein
MEAKIGRNKKIDVFLFGGKPIIFLEVKKKMKKNQILFLS